MDELSLKHKVLYLLMNGWANVPSIAEVLDADEEDIIQAVKELEVDGTIKTHTIH